MMSGITWLKFLRQYGPIPRNDNMYDETIQRSARRSGIEPVQFEHPMQRAVLDCFRNEQQPVSVILTGTAGDGKTHLCRQVWESLGGQPERWSSDDPYLKLEYYCHQTQRNRSVHFIRDLSGWAPQQGMSWDPEKESILQDFSRSIFLPRYDDLFLIAANDGQLVESWRRLQPTDAVQRARGVFEDLLVEDRQEKDGVRLKFFNLSRTSSSELLDRALEAFLEHPGWKQLQEGSPSENNLFGSRCPVRHNYELLQEPLVRSRLRSLLQLCDHNGLHVPIRQILLLLSNAVLGHSDVKDHLLTPNDVPKIIASGTTAKASLYNNLFGGNLSETRRQSITIFEYLERFQIGFETSNRIDNVLIFGEGDEHFGKYFEEFVAQDRFYGADPMFYAAKQEYIEGTDESEERPKNFLDLLVSQRRGMFFKIPEQLESELGLWELTVFKFAGEYLSDVVGVLSHNRPVKRPILARLIKGLNRIFTGMLINSDRELFLAMSGNYSQSKVSRILLDRVSVDPSKGEKILLGYDLSNNRVLLSVFFTPESVVNFDLSLVRYEFLSRIAVEGALPASFSKECYEDLLALKSQLIAAHASREQNEINPSAISVRFLNLTEQGMPDPKFIEIIHESNS